MSDEGVMNVKKRGLGRGLSALFEDEEVATVVAATTVRGAEPSAGGERRTLGTDQLEPCSYQPRRRFDEASIKELAESISIHGVLQPILVRPKSTDDRMYEIVAGERRWRAAQAAHVHEVPVIVRKLDDRQTLEIALIENLQREDLNPIDEARGYRNLIDEFGHSHEKVGMVIGKSRSHVANMLRLLTLPGDVSAMVSDGRLSMGHARTLVGAPNANELAYKILDQGLSVREAEKLRIASGVKSRQTAARQSGREKDVDTLALERDVSAALGMKVSIDSSAGGAGTLKISFRSLDQLDEILHRLSHFPGRKQSG